MVYNLEACVDARSVYESIAAETVRAPADRHLLIHALAVREHLQTKAVDTLTWSDTYDMVADGLAKGAVEREALLLVTNE